jgi:hypothetical protein
LAKFCLIKLRPDLAALAIRGKLPSRGVVFVFE